MDTTNQTVLEQPAAEDPAVAEPPKKTHDIDAILAGIDDGWKRVIDVDILRTVLSSIPVDNITPPSNMILEAFKQFPFSELRVIIVAQDPYPTHGEAHGLAFSSKLSTIPKSLISIYKCLKNTGMIESIPDTADLTNWARQGVLLLNKALTTIVGKRRSHAQQWSMFTDSIIKNISTMCDHHPLYFMLWGKDANVLASIIDNDKHVICDQIHPSPMAQAHIKDESKKFVNCRDFELINTDLKSRGLKPIQWGPPPQYKLYWNYKSNEFNKDVRAHTSWVSSYKHGTKRIFIGGTMPFAIIDGAMEYDTKHKQQWVMTQTELICGIKVCGMELINKPRIEKFHKKAATCNHGETIIFN